MTANFWDILQAREHAGSRHTYADTMHCTQVINLIIGASSEHGACWLAMRYGIAMAMAGHVSLPKLVKSTGLSQERVIQILQDMRYIIANAGGLN